MCICVYVLMHVCVYARAYMCTSHIWIPTEARRKMLNLLELELWVVELPIIVCAAKATSTFNCRTISLASTRQFSKQNSLENSKETSVRGIGLGDGSVG